MDITEILDWCAENNYTLIKKKKHRFDFETIKRIAENSVGIPEGTLTNNTRREENVFGRYLVISYMKGKESVTTTCRRLNLTHAMSSYALKQNILKGNNAYFKDWQNESRKTFVDKIIELGGET